MGAKRELLTVEDIQGAWAIMPTPAKENASDWRAEDTVDLDETARAIEGLIQGGVDGILSLGTLGECATLTWEEKKTFIATAVEVVAGRVPLFVGTTTLNTRDTIRETRAASDMGADGTMLGLPMWCVADLPTAVKYFQDVAEACPDMAICVYANFMAFRFPFPPPFWEQVSKIRQVVTAKYGPITRLTTDINVSRKRIRFLPIEADYYAAARIDPEFMTAFWTAGATCGTTVVTRLRDEVALAKETNDWTAAKDLSDAVGRAFAPLIPKGNFDEFSKYNIGLEKEKMNAAGWMKTGPNRPPYTIIPEEYLEDARKAGRAWAALEEKLRAEGR